ncbi:hypothetical protein [Flavobacterium sp. U410]
MKQIRTSKFSKLVAYYLAMMMFLQITQPIQAYALTEGPSQPEFNAFTPIGTSDMVDLASGDFNYNIPVMDVGGYPINLAYNSGVTMDQEASWVGLGWNLNIGQINRQMRGIPDDFDGDVMTYENNMKDNITVGANYGIQAAVFGFGEANEPPQLKLSTGLGVKYNNYDGIGFSVTGGLSFDISKSLSVGMQMESSVQDGVSASPYASFSGKMGSKKLSDYNLGASVGVSYNSRKGVESMTFSPSVKRNLQTKWAKSENNPNGNKTVSTGGSISFNPDATFTPSKRVGMKSSNYMFNMDIGGNIWGFEPGTKFSGFRTKQGIDDSEKVKTEKAFGYEHTYGASEKDILDFNREKDRAVTRNSTVLPMTNYTYDIYNIQGQGIGGTFRPYSGQVGYVFDNYIEDKSTGGNLGIEIGIGASQDWGFNATVTSANSSTRLWSQGNQALPRFKEKADNAPDYEKIYFKNIGGTHVDTELSILNDDLGKYKAIKFSLAGGKFGRNTSREYYSYNANTGTNIVGGTGKIIRTERVRRGQTIQKLTLAEAKKFGYSKQFSTYAKDHHTAEIRVLKEGGERYVFGRALYNTIKKEVTFDVSGRASDCATGLVNYSGSDNTINNNRDGDQYFNRITTPAYAHTYLLTEVLSSDYQDVDGVSGPSDGDLGTYTKFTYEDQTGNNLYKWRIPFESNKANYDEGLKSNSKDDKGNYLYGEKELAYIKKIETKTHIAIFELSERKDAFGVTGENGGLGNNSKSYKLDKIYLYSKPEYQEFGSNAKPIKVAHFVYDYSLCPGIQNSLNYENFKVNPNTPDSGKLTLKKVYFTYRDSNMGKYTPYEFNYQNNYKYDMKAYDIWGNYKPTPDNVSCKPFNSYQDMSNAEFPYVDQTNRALADEYTTAWHLNSIDLPSGGTIEINYEADDYAFVQDKEAMQMFKIIGAGNGSFNQEVISNRLFDNYFLYIEIPSSMSVQEFKEQYIRNLINDPVYFRFLLNMSDPNPLPGANPSDKYDYVTGYLELANEFRIGSLSGSNQNLAAIRIKSVNKGDGLNSSKQVNPISKAGWCFGRSYLNRLVYGITNEIDSNNLQSVVMELVGTIPSVLQIFQSPNGRLEDKGIASRFITDKSWIRLMHPKKNKIGGGSRVKEVKLHDKWDVMTDHEDDVAYVQFYGQQYSYKTVDGNTSGVATYEPLGGKENPLVKPFYDKNDPGLLLGPDQQNYVEEPLGESFFPSPKITYSRVEVKNLSREKTVTEGSVTKNYIVKKHATGKVVTEFFTSKDYPTVVDYTPISSHYDKSPLGSLLRINDKQHLTMSQGFSVHTNDMDGKMKSQRVYAEGQTAAISGVDYKYFDNTSNTKENGLLNNEVLTIDKEGYVKKNIVGVDYDVINDFRQNKSVSQTPGIRFNSEGLPLALIYLVVPTPLPTYSRHEEMLKTAATTKVVHSSGILRETIAYDAGAVVSTKNLAWDAETGQVLLTETVNEYNDNYFSFNYPAYWSSDYKGMGEAAVNLDLAWEIKQISNGNYALNNFENQNIDKYLLSGDEIWITQNRVNGYVEPIIGDRPRPFKAWVYEVSSNGMIKLLDEEGIRVDQYKVTNGSFKIIRSGYRNMQEASMATVTSMVNPLYKNGQLVQNISNDVNNPLYQTSFTNDKWKEYRIINSSAIEYSNFWAGQCECNLPSIEVDENGNLVLNIEPINYNDLDFDVVGFMEQAYNPYVYNILGNWRAKKSYAYLTGRYHSEHVTPRISGFYEDFYPYYKLDGSKKWVKNTTYLNKWTFASEVTQYNPYGQEVENRDALNRYSSALYGYNYRFPLAVASNTKYRELGYDGFEDYDFSTCDSLSHFGFEGSLDANNIKVSNSYSHTGRKSLRVAPSSDENGRSALLSKKIISCGANATTTKQGKAKRTIK